MDRDIEQWLPKAGMTLDGGPETPRGLYERLKFVAELLREAGDRGQETGARRRAPGNKLLYRDSKGMLHVVAIGEGMTIGREAPADLVIEAPKLSRQHFRLHCTGDAVLLEDQGSRNGTFVNGRKVKRRELLDGDIIEAGGMVFVLLRA
jgi:hypothetical protein